MKKCFIILGIFLCSISSYSFAQTALEIIKSLETQSSTALMTMSEIHSHNLVVKFKSKRLHKDLLQTPETKAQLREASEVARTDKQAFLEQYNLSGIGSRERGLIALSELYKATGIQIKHVRSSALGANNIIALSTDDLDTVIKNLAASGMFEYVEAVNTIVNDPNKIRPAHIPASIPVSSDVRTNALNKSLYNDVFYLRETYIDEQQPNNIGAHSLLKASLYAQENNNLNRKVRVAVLDTGSYPHEDVVWSDEGADFVSSTLSSYHDCAVVDESNSGGDAVCAKENFIEEQRDTDPTDKSWFFQLDENGEPIGDGTISIDGHGLQVGSAIAAIRNNGKGIVGAMDANDVELVNVRVLSPVGGFDFDVTDAIVWSAGGEVPGMPNISQKVDVINLSLGGFSLVGCEQSQKYIDAIEFARSQNVVVVAAAGNDGRDVDGYSPGECLGVLTVGANKGNGELSNFSNFGEEIDVTFEGSDVRVATINDSIYTNPENSGFCKVNEDEISNKGCYALISGTSLSAPLASATSAMVRMVQSGIDESEIRAIIAKTAPLYEVDNSGNATRRSVLTPNAGLGNAYFAVTTRLDKIEISNVNVSHRFGNFNSNVEQNYIQNLIENSNKENVCELYDFSWGTYRDEIVGLNYVLYGSNAPTGEMLESNSTVIDDEIGSAVTGLYNIKGFNRIGVQADFNGVLSEIVEFDLTQASKPTACL